jgi:hypothetical protein
MAETSFAVTYDGPDLDTGEMSVRDLAPALLALGELFTLASLATHPEQEPVSLNIKATAEGSFEVHLILKTLQDAITILNSNPVSALQNLVATIVETRWGLFALIRRLKGQDVQTVREIGDEPGTVTLVMPDGTALSGVPEQVAKLYNDLAVRRAAREVVEPLARNGIDVVRFRVDGLPAVEITEQDLAAYELPPAPEDVLTDQEIDMAVTIVGPMFERGKWKFRDGQSKFSAYIDDEEFLNTVAANVERFGSGDVLRCRVRVIQTIRPTGEIKKDYRVLKVERHIAAPRQMTIDEGL